MTKSTIVKSRVVLAGLVGALAFCGLAAAGAGAPTSVSAVEGAPFSGAVATYSSTVTPNERFVEQAYLDMLDRSAVPSELSSFDNFLGNGGTRTQVAQALLGSDEYRASVVGSTYTTFLRRPATPGELAFWLSVLKAGTTDEQLRAAVIGSGEYLASQGGGTVAGFLNALYLDVLGRPIDAVAEALYNQQLTGGATRTDVALDVLTSLEARQDLVGSLYGRFLHRSADAAGLLTFAVLLGNGGTDEDVIASLAGSSEYFGKVPASFASATIAWGDGSPVSAGAISGNTVGGSHTYADEGAYPITVVIHDVDGTLTILGRAAVADAPLSAKGTSFAAAKKTLFTTTVATFSDGNAVASPAEFTATVAWGDGQSSTGAVSALPAGGFAVTGSHRYATRGNYTVVVHVVDDGGSTGDAASSAAVAK